MTCPTSARELAKFNYIIEFLAREEYETYMEDDGRNYRAATRASAISKNKTKECLF